MVNQATPIQRGNPVLEMFALSFGAALLFFAIFWSIRHPGDPARFALVALIFAVPQLFFPLTSRVLCSPRAVLYLGGAIAAVCAAGSLFPLSTAKVHVYSAPWFLVLAWYFNLSCLHMAVALFKRGAKGAVLALLHVSFVIVCIGMAIDGIYAVEGAFKVSPKMAPGQMPPASGYFAQGERSNTLIEHDEDPGITLPFSIELKSFDVEFYPPEELTLTPQSPKGGLKGVSFELLGMSFEDSKEFMAEIPYERVKESFAVIGVETRSEKGMIEIPLGGERTISDINAEVRLLDDYTSEKLKNYEVKIVRKGVPMRYTSVVDVLEHDSTLRAGEKIEVNHPLRVLGWSVYQSSWGEFISLEDWENLPGNLRTPRGFREHLKLAAITPCSFFTIVYRPGKHIVYGGYILMFLSLLAFLAVRRPRGGGR